MTCLAPAVSPAAEPLARSVLILDQSDPNAPWSIAVRDALRSTLNAGSSTPIAVFSEILDLGHFNGPQYEELLRPYPREKSRGKPIGVIVVLGSTALEIVLRLRAELWPVVPMVFAAV